MSSVLPDMHETSINAISGAIAGFASSILITPLDVVKTRMQAQRGLTLASPELYRSLNGSLRRIWREEGIRGLYRGLGPMMVGYLPTWAVYFTVYERAKHALRDESILHPHISHIISAVIGGITSTTVTNPIWVVKTRLMTQDTTSQYRYSSTFDAFYQMYRKEGVLAFYLGLGPSLLGVSHVAVQFPLYESLKFNLGTTTPAIIVSSTVSKIAASCMTYPHEVIRTRLQSSTKYSGIINCAKCIVIQEGWRGLYSGLTVNLIRTVPATVCTLWTFERVRTLLENMKNKP